MLPSRTLLFDIITATPSCQPTSFPTGFTSIVDSTWSAVQEPAVSGSAFSSNVILSAAWSSSSTVVAVGDVRTTKNGLILVSTTGGSSWSALSVSMTDSIVHYSSICIEVDGHTQINFLTHSFVHPSMDWVRIIACMLLLNYHRL